MQPDHAAFWDFLSAQIDSLEQGDAFATIRGWQRITDPEAFEAYAPKGALPYDFYSPWFVDSGCFLIATWSLFNLPVKPGVLNCMTCNEVWLNEIGERDLLEFLSDQFGDNPLGRKAYEGGIDAWIWGEGLHEKPDRRDLLRAGILGDDMAKVSFIRMFMA